MTKDLLKILLKVVKMAYNRKGEGGHAFDIFSFDFYFKQFSF